MSPHRLLSSVKPFPLAEAFLVGALLIGCFAVNTCLMNICLVNTCTAAEGDSLQWRIHQLAVDGNEGIDLADFDKDGKLDVIAGRSWYAAPDFVARPVRTIEDWNGYVHSNGDYAYDVDGDGWTDVIAGDFIPTEVYWYRNPGAEQLRLGKMWPKQLLVDTQASRNEGQLFQDMDGDGKPEWIVNSWAKNVPMHIWKLSTEKRAVQQGNKTVEKEVPSLAKIVVGTEGNGHGMGVGDLNGDGRLDIFVGQGWYENPADKLVQQWKFHPDWDVHASIPVIIRDLDGDGRSDVIVGQGHNFGLHWWQQLEPAADGKLAWKKHLIDDTFSQPHSLHMADLDGDGSDELITGKRFYAHNGGDPGGKEPPCLFYYRWDAKTNTFEKHIIDKGVVGTGLQIRTGDLNDDGRLDIAVAGKSGTFIVFNEGK